MAFPRMPTRNPLHAVAMAVGLAGVAVPALAQEDRTARRAAVVDVPLAERSRILVNVPNDDTNEIYEAYLAIHFPLGGSLQDSYDRAREHERADWAVLPSFSMISNLRQLREDSAPVRSPSYMPRLRVSAVRTSAIPRDFETALTRQWVFDATLGHYSNGQDGCLFVQQSEADDCRLPTGLDDDSLEVRRGGSFSSHYLEAGAAYRWLRWDGTPMGNGRHGAASVLGVYVRFRDYTTLSGWPGGMDEDLRRLYGDRRLRVGVDGTWEHGPTDWWSGATWVNAWAEGSNGDAQAARGLRFSAEAGTTFDRLGGTGLFVRYYDGHDDYNAAFLTPLRVLQIGVSLGGERRPSLRP